MHTDATADDLSLAEAAALAGRSEVTVRRWVAAGDLPARRVLNRVLVRRADLDRLLAGDPVVPGTTGVGRPAGR